MRYTDLIFDLYGTLVDIHTEENRAVWDKCAIFFGFYGVYLTGEELERNFYDILNSRKAKAGQSYECFPDIPFVEIVGQIFKERGVFENVEKLSIQVSQLFRILSIEYIRLYPKVLEALDYLRKKGFRLWLLSNAQQVFTSYELAYLRLDKAFDGIYLSSDYGCRKPDERFYKALIEENNLDVSKCIMIGNDRETDIAGAKRFNMTTLYMHTELTPKEQKAADEAFHPDRASFDCKAFEYEGDNWNELVRLIEIIANS